MNELYNNSVYQGSFLSAPNEGMVGRIIANLYNVEINDVLKIGNSEFIITGIFDIPTQNESIWIHYGEATDRTRWTIRYYIQTSGVNEQYENYLRSFFRQRGFFVDVLSPNEYIGRMQAHLVNGWLVSFFLSVIAVLYCVLNIGTI
jgi:hypothetical protein